MCLLCQSNKSMYEWKVSLFYQAHEDKTLISFQLSSSPQPSQVKSHAVRALGNLLRFLRESQLTKSAFQRPLEDAVRALVKTVQAEAIMKVRWNTCYALGNAFRNPAMPLGKSLVPGCLSLL